jgi:hypothetical protein
MLQDEFPDEHAAYVVFTSEADDKHSRRLQRREVNAVASEAPQLMHWSERPITWSRDDHPAMMPSPGAYAMVLDSTFSTERRACRFSRVLIDSGSSINILYRDTMENLGIKEKQLQPSWTMFHGIVPGLSCSPIGKIQSPLFAPAIARSATVRLARAKGRKRYPHEKRLRKNAIRAKPAFRLPRPATQQPAGRLLA